MRRVVKPAGCAVERCAAVCVSASAAVAVTLLVGAEAGYNVCLPFCITAVVSAWYGPMGRGVVAALLSALFLEHFLDIPLSKADFGSEDFKLVGVFALVSIAASWFNITRRRVLNWSAKGNRTAQESAYIEAARGTDNSDGL